MKPINNRLTEITFVILLLITVGQVLWWVLGNIRIWVDGVRYGYFSNPNLRRDSNYSPCHCFSTYKTFEVC